MSKQFRDLLSTFGSINLPRHHITCLRIIDATDYEGVKRKVREWFKMLGVQVTDDYLERGVLALKQYYALAVVNPTADHAVSDAVDPFWHAHMLHSREYAEMCQKSMGGFMHHLPLNQDEEVEVNRIDELYRYTQDVFDVLFDHVDREFFPRELVRERMVCSHYGDSIADRYSLFIPGGTTQLLSETLAC